MAQWMKRILAAIGVQGEKTEPDVSYDPVTHGTDLGPGGDGRDQEMTPGPGEVGGVGRVTGETSGGVGESGAERRQAGGG
jgi:hypothetical protein